MSKMNTEEAFVKFLQMHGIKHAFGIIGSAMMPASDLFPKTGITFWDVAHECNGDLRENVFGDCAKRPGYHKLPHPYYDSVQSRTRLTQHPMLCVLPFKSLA